jgi:hypothetical protein
MRTYLIFQDLPMHVEYRVDDMQLIPEGTVIHFRIDLKHPRDQKKIRNVNAPYTVVKRRLIFSSEKSSAQGLTQYLELDIAEK